MIDFSLKAALRAAGSALINLLTWISGGHLEWGHFGISDRRPNIHTRDAESKVQWQRPKTGLEPVAPRKPTDQRLNTKISEDFTRSCLVAVKCGKKKALGL